MFPTPSHWRFVHRSAAAILALAMLQPAGAVMAQSPQPTQQQLLEALRGRETRGMEKAQPKDPSELRSLLERLRQLETRAFSAKERTPVTAEATEIRRKIAEKTADEPQIDLEIYFDFNSWRPSSASVELLDKLGRVMTSPEMKGRGFLVAGHTDAKGKDAVNLQVSKLRADAVRTYLVEKFGVDPALVRTIGHGEERLKDPSKPFAAINRRVQITTLPNGTLTASR